MVNALTCDSCSVNKARLTYVVIFARIVAVLDEQFVGFFQHNGVDVKNDMCILFSQKMCIQLSALTICTVFYDVIRVNGPCEFSALDIIWEL